jgi:hypothetical protein
MWTIFNAAGKAVVNCDSEPNHDDLATRGERAIFHVNLVDLPEVLLVDGAVKWKPLVRLEANVEGNIATVTVNCDDNTVLEIPLLISGTPVMKPIGTFTIAGEVGVNVRIDVDREQFRGNALEVSF